MFSWNDTYRIFKKYTTSSKQVITAASPLYLALDLSAATDQSFQSGRLYECDMEKEYKIPTYFENSVISSVHQSKALRRLQYNIFYAASIVSIIEVVSKIAPTRNYSILKSVYGKHN
jgi:hypothetical protein